ncbi:MAG: NlpC/P60 family protein [Lachnospiraceae bacterium]|jgi:cell wall-associated NlpC family hydrolase
MKRYFRLTTTSAMAMLLTASILGMSFMLVIDKEAEPQAEKVTATGATGLNTPDAGISSVMNTYFSTNGDSSIDMLSTTAVGIGMPSNKYYGEDGSSLGRLIVCTAADYVNVYDEMDSESAVNGKIYRYAVATLVAQEAGWCKVVSGDVAGYVKEDDFLFGKEAEALEDKTYKLDAVVDTDELTLRAGRSTEETALCILAPDSAHRIIDDSNEEGYNPDMWTKVHVKGVGEGYVMSCYIRVDEGRRYAISTEAEKAAAAEIEEGLDEAQYREAKWLAERLEREEAQKLAFEIARRECERAQEAMYDAAAAAENADPAAAYEAAYAAEDAAHEARYAASQTSDEDWHTAQEYADEAAGYVADAWYFVEQAEINEANYIAWQNSMNLRYSVVDYACSFAGWLPYVSGGASLSSGADCSGFVYAIYSEFGYELPRGSNQQSYAGYSVSLAEILPGDIIVYPGHVGIYVGDGLKVHAPYPGQTVTINSMYFMTILDVRRIID